MSTATNDVKVIVTAEVSGVRSGIDAVNGQLRGMAERAEGVTGRVRQPLSGIEAGAVDAKNRVNELNQAFSATGAKPGLAAVSGQLSGVAEQAAAANQSLSSVAETSEITAGRIADFGRNIVAALASSAFVGKLVSIQRQFDVINSSLVTMTGSTEAAAAAFSAIQEFAATTPYSLQEVAQSFVKLKALGLDPSARALESYGNTASAMGKSLDQLIEAVADASTNEFERLKEFGIKSRQEGERVTFTFRGVSTSVGKSAEEIQAYLLALGENEFAGAMAERAKTLDGAISNLGDAWDGMFLKISQQQAGSLIYDTVKLASGAIEDATKIIEQFSSATDDASKATGAFDVVQDGLRITFETVAVLGANTAFVLKSIGREIGGIAAQASALLSGDFSGAAAIRGMMLADAKAAREEVDALSARIMNPPERPRGLSGVLGGGSTGRPGGPTGDTPKPTQGADSTRMDFLADAHRDAERESTARLKEAQQLAQANATMAQSVEGLGKAYAQRNQLAAESMLSERERELAESLRRVSERADQARESLSQKAAMLQDNAAAQAEYQRQLAAVNAAEEAQIAIEKANHSSRLAMQADWTVGANRALTRYNDQAMDVAGATEQAFMRAFSGMEDALVEFAMTGKLNFSNLANSIISEIIRIQIQIIRIQIRASMTQALGGASGGSGLLGALASGISGLFGNFGTAMTYGTSIGSQQTAMLAAQDAVFHAKGGVYDSPSLSAYSGGVYDRPQFFAFAKGAGVFAEAGPEAIMPLQRDSRGRLGVSASGGTGPQSIRVEIRNEGKPQEVASAQPRFDLEGMVIEVVTRDLANEGTIAKGMQSRYGLSRASGAYG